MKKLSLPLAIAALAVCGVSEAQTVLGSPGAGFQKWTVGNLNNNNAPYWDAPTTAFGAYVGNQTSKNAGWCLISSGDCQGIDSALHAPGVLPYWGMPYDSANDSGGAIDPQVWFKRAGSRELKATLHLNLATNTTEINEFGWFETNASGSVVGTRHKLFQGSGVPPGSLTPDPIGKSVKFKPTEYFGYYFSDVSEGGCFTYTLYSLNDQNGCATHNLVVFSTDPSSTRATFWIAGEDPAGCQDGDCNLTLVKVRGAEGSGD